MIDILLATYNGENYLEQQLYSLIYQTYTDWKLIIHDDGSSDATVDIIKKFTVIDSRITLIDDGVKCGGACNNFMHLLKFSKAPYIMFCDQDDIWFDSKVEFMIEKFEKSEDATMPCVLYSNSYSWIPKKGIKGKSTLFYYTDLSHFIFSNSGVQGCVSLFNSKARDMMLNIDASKLAMHDHLLQLLCIVFGRVLIHNIPLMLYREHELQVTGKTNTSRFTGLINIFKNKEIPVVDKRHYIAIKYFYEFYLDKLDLKSKMLIEKYLEMPQSTLLSNILSVFHYEFRAQNSKLYLISKLIMRKHIN